MGGLLLVRNLDFAKLDSLKKLWRAYFQAYSHFQPLFGKLKPRPFRWDLPHQNLRWSPIGGFFKNGHRTRKIVFYFAEKMLWSPKYGFIWVRKPLKMTVYVLASKWHPRNENLRTLQIGGFLKNCKKSLIFYFFGHFRPQNGCLRWVKLHYIAKLD